MKVSWLLSLPKSIWFNIRYLPLRQAIWMPFAVHYKTKCHIQRGGVKLNATNVRPFMIHYGFHEVPIIENEVSLLDIRGTLTFNGTAYIGKGSRIVVEDGAIVELGDHFAISAASFIYCYKHIKCGNNIQLAWGDLLMDSDSHVIYGEDGNRINQDKEIVLGDNIWMACDCKVLKGAVIPDNCVIGANSVVTAKLLEPNSLIMGTPAKMVKKISGWEI